MKILFSRRAFTLIEMLVVITIIAVLAAFLLPALSSVKTKTRKTQCMNNTRQVATGMAALLSELGDALPYRNDPASSGEAAEQLLPYVKNIIEVFDCPANDGIVQDATTEFPSHAGTYTEYEINSNLFSTATGTRRQNSIKDYSLVVVAYDFPYDPSSSQRAHEDGINCGYLDGHAAWLADEDMYTPTNFMAAGFAY